MKKWTVMLIPQDRGNSHSFTLSALPLWSIGGVMLLLTFLTAFFYQRQHAVVREYDELQHANNVLKLNNTTQKTSVALTVLDDNEIEQREDALRTEYERSISVITAELSELFDMEAKARSITGMTPRSEMKQEATEDTGGGKGGPPTGVGAVSFFDEDEAFRPKHIIYGMASPSADLILQEIKLRARSFTDLVDDMEIEIDRIARTPSIWPLADRAGYISSRFGNRRDPFNNRVRHHDGTDIAAHRGTKVYATARGIVKAAFKDRYLGNIVKVEHGNSIETWYAHMNAMEVQKGDVVERNDIIGSVGSTGRSTGSHLHYEVHVNEKPVNGQKYLTD